MNQSHHANMYAGLLSPPANYVLVSAQGCEVVYKQSILSSPAHEEREDSINNKMQLFYSTYIYGTTKLARFWVAWSGWSGTRVPVFGESQMIICCRSLSRSELRVVLWAKSTEELALGLACSSSS